MHSVGAASGVAQAIHGLVQGSKVGVAIDVNQVVPASASDRDRLAASQWSSARDAWFLDPLFGRGYPALGLDAGEVAAILTELELLGAVSQRDGFFRVARPLG